MNERRVIAHRAVAALSLAAIIGLPGLAVGVANAGPPPPPPPGWHAGPVPPPPPWQRPIGPPPGAPPPPPPPPWQPDANVIWDAGHNAWGFWLGSVWIPL